MGHYRRGSAVQASPALEMHEVQIRTALVSSGVRTDPLRNNKVDGPKRSSVPEWRKPIEGSTRRRGHNRPFHRVQLDKGDDPGLRVVRDVASVRILGDAPRNLIGQRTVFAITSTI
jgi:hypothetical protein